MKTISELQGQLHDKKVLVRCNFDVPMEEGKVLDTTRIEDCVKTIKWLREQGARVVLVGHYDRPEGNPDPEKSLRPVIEVLSPLIGESIEFAEYSQNLREVSIPDAPIVLLENLRFWSGEEENDAEFVDALSTLGEIYVNEAFANCHREHASITGITAKLPSYAGLSLTKEVEILSKVRNHPDKPLVVVIGGAKLETKEPLIGVFADVADKILVGGKSAVELQDRTDLPANIILSELTETERDITPESARQFAEIIMQAKTVIWNGTMGVYEEEENREGTRIVAEAVNQTPAFTLVGGGDTETALTVLNLEHGIDFISTGGGAMLLFLSEGTLPGIEVLA